MEFKVQWEEQRSIVIEADSADAAEEMMMNGEFDSKDIESGELMSMPEAYELKDEQNRRKKWKLK